MTCSTTWWRSSVPFDYEGNLGAVANSLTDYNTTTATPDLSDGMTSRVKTIFNNDPNYFGSRIDLLPAVFVWMDNAEEEFGSLGETGPTGNRKYKTVTYNVLGVYVKEGATSEHTAVLQEVYRLAENMEGVFQKEMTLSGTALWVNPVSTQFLEPGLLSGAWVKGVLMKLEARYLFR